MCACTHCIKFMIGTICSGIQYMSSEQPSIEEAQSFISCLCMDRRWRYCFFCLTIVRFGSLGVIFFLRREKYIELPWSSYLSTISPSACHSVLSDKHIRNEPANLVALEVPGSPERCASVFVCFCLHNSFKCYSPVFFLLLSLILGALLWILVIHISNDFCSWCMPITTTVYKLF